MVRVKERYLLVNIQYPEAQNLNLDIPNVIAWNQPTNNLLTTEKLVRIIRQTAEKYYGIFGRSCLETMSGMCYGSHSSSIPIPY